MTVGKDLQKTYIQHHVDKSSKFTMIRSGFDVSRFFQAGEKKSKYKQEFLNKFSLPSDSIIVGTAARLEPRKGIQYLLNVADRINGEFPHVHYFIAGEGEQKDELEQYANHLGIKNRIHFVGFIKEIEKFFASLDIFVLSSLWEGLPRSLVQAGAIGLPVVTFRVEGVNEIVINKKNGFIVESKDLDSFRNRIVDLLRNRELATHMGKNGRCFVNKTWDYHSMVKKIDQEYRKQIDKKMKNVGAVYATNWLHQHNKQGHTSTIHSNDTRKNETQNSQLGVVNPEEKNTSYM